MHMHANNLVVRKKKLRPNLTKIQKRMFSSSVVYENKYIVNILSKNLFINKKKTIPSF